MKNISMFIGAIIIIAILSLYLFCFQVSEGEAVLVTTFGKPDDSAISEPGLKFKWPAPIQDLERFDTRSKVFEGQAGETTTKDNVPIIATSFIVWKIEDPIKFLKAGLMDKIKFNESFNGQISNAKNSIIGEHNFNEFVNTDPSKIHFSQIEDMLYNSLKEPMLKDYGVLVQAVGIKKLAVSEKITEAVFSRMRADRQAKTASILSQGESEANRIKADAESKRTELLAAADSRAKAIRGMGDAEAAQYYQMLEADPELAMFLRDLEALKKILAERATIVLGAETYPIKLLKGVPDIKPEEK